MDAKINQTWDLFTERFERQSTRRASVYLRDGWDAGRLYRIKIYSTAIRILLFSICKVVSAAFRRIVANWGSVIDTLTLLIDRLTVKSLRDLAVKAHKD